MCKGKHPILARLIMPKLIVTKKEVNIVKSNIKIQIIKNINNDKLKIYETI